MIATGQLGFDEGLGGQEVEVHAVLDLFVVFAAMDDLLVVDRDHGHAVGLGIQVGEGVEVADDQVGVEVGHAFEVGGSVAHEHRGGAQHVLEQGHVTIHRAIVVGDGEATDLDNVLEGLLEELVGAPGHDDADGVALFFEMAEDDFGTGRVAHALADHAVQDSHGIPPLDCGSFRTCSRHRAMRR